MKTPLAIGNVVAGRFAIERAIGHGGMGSIFRALDVESGVPVALKVLHEESVEESERERFSREAKILSELSHPGIVGYVTHGYLETGGQPYLVMEWLDGEDLAARIGKRGLTVAESIMLIRNAAQPLVAAHRRGVVHRDLKPSNIFLREGKIERVALLDFGIARKTQSAALTRTGAVLGTPAYMAPEQARGLRDITPAADVFSLGCVLFECLTGAPPFNAEHLVAQLVKTLFEDAPRLRAARPDMPPELDALLARMLAKTPSARPAGAAELLIELDGLSDLPDLPTPPSIGPSSLADSQLAASEQQFVSVIMAMEGPSVGLLATMNAAEPRSQDALRDELRRAMGAGLMGSGTEVECLADGSVVATLRHAANGAPTDQAAQAARCALLIRERWPEASIALATGRAVLGGEVPFGEAIDRAAQVLSAQAAAAAQQAAAQAAQAAQAAAHTGEFIWLDDVTASLLDARFSVTRTPGGSLILHGERLSADESRPLLGKPTPCVGREQELGMLEGMLSSAIEDGSACAVLITAVPGMGKSRLRHELLRRLASRGDEVVVLMGRGDPVLAGSPLGLIGGVIRNLCGIVEDQPAAEQRARLEERVGKHIDADDKARIIEALTDLCDLPPIDEAAGRSRSAPRDTTGLVDRVRPPFLAFLRAECERAPMLLILDDLQWGDVHSVNLVGAALRELRDQPFMVMALARPEVDDLFPKIWAGAAQLMALRPLGKRASERLITQVIGDRIPADAVARIADQAGGNALYLEEIVRAVAEGKGEELPDSVLAMVQARLSRLDPEARRVLRAASIFGNRFWRGGVRRLLGQDQRTGATDRWLLDLVDAEIIEHHRESLIPGDAEYAFRHSLMREAAYGWLTEADRALGHAAAAKFFSAGIEARYHYGRALAALSHLPDTPPNRRTRVDVTLDLIRIARASESPAHNLELLNAAEKQLKSLAPADVVDNDRHRLARIHYWIGVVYYYSNQPPMAARYFQQVLDHDSVDEELVALPSAALGRMYALQGRFGKASGLLERSRAIVAQSGDWADWSWSTSMLGMSLAAKGRCDEGLKMSRSGAERAEQTGNTTVIAAARGPVAGAYLFAGDMPGMIRACDACAEAAERSGDRIFTFMTRGIQIWAESRLGNHAKVTELLALTQSIAKSFNRQILGADWYAAAASEAALNRGDPEEALRLAKETIAVAKVSGGIFASGMAERVWAQALAAMPASRWEDVCAHMEASLAAHLHGECHIEVARTRLAWGLLAQRRGDEANARALLDQATSGLAAANRADEIEAATAAFNGRSRPQE